MVKARLSIPSKKAAAAKPAAAAAAAGTSSRAERISNEVWAGERKFKVGDPRIAQRTEKNGDIDETKSKSFLREGMDFSRSKIYAIP
jgi:hypothetical protein